MMGPSGITARLPWSPAGTHNLWGPLKTTLVSWAWSPSCLCRFPTVAPGAQSGPGAPTAQVRCCLSLTHSLVPTPVPALRCAALTGTCFVPGLDCFPALPHCCAPLSTSSQVFSTWGGHPPSQAICLCAVCLQALLVHPNSLSAGIHGPIPGRADTSLIRPTSGFSRGFL